MQDAGFEDNVMTFGLLTDGVNVKYSALTGEDFLSTLNFQFRNVGRTTTGELASFNPSDSNAITGVLTEGTWKAESLGGFTLNEAKEVTDITFAEFKLLMSERFAKGNTNFSQTAYNDITVKVVDGVLKVTFPQNFLKWDEIHSYNSNNYNITAHLDKSKLVKKLSSATTNVSGQGIQSFKITLQGSQGGNNQTPINVVLTRK